MTAAPYTAGRRDKTETATARNRRVRREITAAMRARRINGALCDFLQIVIDECHLDSYAYHSRQEWAALVGKSVSSVKVYIRVGCELGYLRRDDAGRLYVVGLKAPAEPVSVASEADSMLPDVDRILPIVDRILPDASFNGFIQDLQDDQGAATGAGGADMLPDQNDEAETIGLLREIGCFPQTVRLLGYLPAGQVRATIEAARRCGRAHDLPAFVAYCLTTGGVYDRPRVRASPRPAVPSPEARDAAYDELAARQVPTMCPTCGSFCPAEWKGHCPRCEPESFDAIGGDP